MTRRTAASGSEANGQFPWPERIPLQRGSDQGRKSAGGSSGRKRRPILPYALGAAHLAFLLSAALSSLALLVAGGVLARLTGVNVTWGAARMLLAGGAAAAVTYGIGRLIGVSVGSLG